MSEQGRRRLALAGRPLWRCGFAAVIGPPAEASGLRQSIFRSVQYECPLGASANVRRAGSGALNVC